MLEQQENYRNCFLCGTTQRLQTDHINEYHAYNKPPNIREIQLCKYCHSQKGLRKLRETNHIETVQELKARLDKDTKLKQTLRYTAEKAMSQYKDADIYPVIVTVDDTDLYDLDLEFNF
mgnify:FL=1